MEAYLPFEDVSLDSFTQPLTGRKRIQYTCFAVSPLFVMIGANTGGVYVFGRASRQFISILPGQAGGVTCLAISPDESLVAAGCQQDAVAVHACPTQHAWSGRLSALAHLQAEARALCWQPGTPAWAPSTVYVGTAAGKVLAVNVSKKKTAAVSATITPMLQLDSSVCELVLRGHSLLVSTLSYCYLCNVQMEVFAQVGTQARSAPLGACFLDADTLLCARPGLRLWEVMLSGRIVATHQMKPALHQTCVRPVISVCGDRAAVADGGSGGDKAALGFIRLVPLPATMAGAGVVAAFSGHALFVLDVRQRRVTLWTSVRRRVLDIAACGDQLYVQCEGGGLRRIVLRQPTQIVRELRVRSGAAECARFLMSHSQVVDLCRSRRALDVLTEALACCEDKAVRAELARLMSVAADRLAGHGYGSVGGEVGVNGANGTRVAAVGCGDDIGDSEGKSARASSVESVNSSGRDTDTDQVTAKAVAITEAAQNEAGDHIRNQTETSDRSGADSVTTEQPHSLDAGSSTHSTLTVQSLHPESQRVPGSQNLASAAEQAIVFRSTRHRRRARTKQSSSQLNKSASKPSDDTQIASDPVIDRRVMPTESLQTQSSENHVSLDRPTNDGYAESVDERYDVATPYPHLAQRPVPVLGVYGYTPGLTLNSEVLDMFSDVVGDLRGAVSSGAQSLVRRLMARRGTEEADASQPRRQGSGGMSGGYEADEGVSPTAQTQAVRCRSEEAMVNTASLLEAALAQRTGQTDCADLSLEPVLLWLDALAALFIHSEPAGMSSVTTSQQQRRRPPSQTELTSLQDCSRDRDNTRTIHENAALRHLCSEATEYITDRRFTVAVPGLRDRVIRLLGRVVLYLGGDEQPCDVIQGLVKRDDVDSTSGASNVTSVFRSADAEMAVNGGNDVDVCVSDAKCGSESTVTDANSTTSGCREIGAVHSDTQADHGTLHIKADVESGEEHRETGNIDAIRTNGMGRTYADMAERDELEATDANAAVVTLVPPPRHCSHSAEVSADSICPTVSSPAATVPVDPICPTVSSPAAAVPADFICSTVSSPAATVPVDPICPTVSSPAATVPADSICSTVSSPAATVSTEPAATVPTEPAATVPTEPAATVPTEPDAAVPTEPDAAVLTEPAATVPADPVCPTVSSPGAAVPADSVCPTVSSPADPVCPTVSSPVAGSPAWLAEVLSRRLFYLLDAESLHDQLASLPAVRRFRLWRSLFLGTEPPLGVFGTDAYAAAAGLSVFSVARLAAGVVRSDPVAGAELCVRSRSQLTPLDVLYLCRCSVPESRLHWTLLQYLLRVSPADEGITSDREVADAAEAVLTAQWRQRAASLTCVCGLPRPGAHRAARPAPALLRRLQAERLAGAALLRARWSLADVTGCLLMMSASAELPADVPRSRMLAAVIQLDDASFLPAVAGLLPASGHWESLLPLLQALRAARCACGQQIRPADGCQAADAVTLETLLTFVASRKGPSRALALLKTATETMDRHHITPRCYRDVMLGTLLDTRLEGLGAAWAACSTVTMARPLSQQAEDQLCSELGVLTAPSSHPEHGTGGVVVSLTADCPACCLPLRNRHLLRPRGLLLFNCGHTFHAVCLLRRAATCLLCRR